MAFQLENMSIDYKKLLKLVPTQRAELAQSGAINDMISVMTPGQLISLFPRYYRQSLPDVGQINQYAASMDSALSGGTPRYSSSPKSQTSTYKPADTGTEAPTRPGFIKKIVSGITPPSIPSSVGTGVSDPRIKKILRLISSAEGTTDSYDTQYGHQNLRRQQAGGKPLTQMTINEVRQLMMNTPKNKRAMGKYQFVPDTFNEVVVQMGLKGDELFDAKMQDQLIIHRLKRKRGLDDFLSGKITKEKFSQNMAYEFASFPSIVHGGRAAHGGVGENTSTPRIGLNTFLNELENIKLTPPEETSTLSGTTGTAIVAAPGGAAKTMILSLGTNDFTNSRNTYQNTIDAINEGRKKGYNVVVVPPVGNNSKFKAAYDEVMRAVNETGAPIEQPQSYSSDGYHPTTDEYKRIGKKYQGAVVVGDSIAVGIGKHVDNGQTVATEGIRTDDILSKIKSEQVATFETSQISPATATFDPAIFTQLDPRLKEWYDDASDPEKALLEASITQKGVDSINQIMSEYPMSTATAITTIEDNKFISEKDPRQFYEGNKAVKADDEIWDHVHPDLARDRDRIYAGGNKIRTGAILAADASFRFAANRGIPMRVAIEGGVDSHSANHLEDGIGEALDIKPGTRDERGRDVETSNTWEKFELDPLDVATISAATIQSLGGVARIGIAGPGSSSGVHTQDTGNEGLGISEEYGGMSWAYGPDPHGARGGKFRKQLQSGYFGKEYSDVVDSLFSVEEEQQSTSTVPSSEAEAIAQGSPVSATAAQAPTATPEEAAPTVQLPVPDAATNASPVSATAAQANNVPALASGGTIPPGENIAGINTDTGKLEFVANDRERIRVDPATLENTQQSSAVTQEDTARLETQMTPQQQRNPQPVAQPLPDPMAFDIMAAGFSAVPPSQVRATNRAKLYGEGSNNLVNGHFA